MTMVDSATGWFEIKEVPYYSIEDVINDKDNYIDKSLARISQLFNQAWLSRYPRPRESRVRQWFRIQDTFYEAAQRL